MGKIPIEIEKVTVKTTKTTTERTHFQLIILEASQKWKKSFRCNVDELKKFRDMIDSLIDETTTAEKLNLPFELANKIDEHHRKDQLCLNCKYKASHSCVTCIFTLQSPLERKLFLALKDAYISFECQFALNWKGEKISVEGKAYDDPENNFKEVLTIADFYIQKGNTRLCIYTDGHTYHERTEEQAQRDKKIDRKLQELGFTVLRYTGKDVNDGVTSITQDIKKWL
jgi:hypothetical protein